MAEVHVLPKSLVTKVRLMYLSGDEDLSRYGHEVLRIKLKSLESFITDLTNAQFGKCGIPVMATETYMQKHVRYLEKEHPFGFQRQHAAGQIKQRGWLGVIYAMLDQVHDHLKSTVEIWETERRPLGAMVKLKEADFQREQAAFVHYITEDLKLFKRDGDESGRWRAPAGTIGEW